MAHICIVIDFISHLEWERLKTSSRETYEKVNDLTGLFENVLIDFLVYI